MKLTDFVTLNTKTSRNRLVMAPMVIGMGCVDGMATEAHVMHYRARAHGGVGVVVLEATAVQAEGRLGPQELGLWEDGQIRPMARIAETCRENGALVLVQIHHAGPRTHGEVGKPVGACDYEGPRGPVRALTPGEIAEVRAAFIAAAVRARRAGFDGVELHGCHGYLLNDFANPLYNHRTDEYGGSTENRTRLAREIIAGIRKACGERFLITIRMGGSEPDLKESLAIARAYVDAGVQALSISFGMADEHPDVPTDFPLDPRFYEASAIREAIGHRVPVMAVGNIRRAAHAQAALEHADMVCVARGLLADDWFAAAVLRGKDPIYRCAHCKGGCRWPNACPMSDKRRREHPETPV